MQFDFDQMAPVERYKLLLATVLPRPIAWITTKDPSGAINAAPFSFFNVFGSDPATVGVGIGSKLDLIGRMEGAWYTKTTDRFEMPPIALHDWKGPTGANGALTGK